MYVKKQTMKFGGNWILIREAPSATSQGKGKTAWKVEALYSVSASGIGSIDITSAAPGPLEQTNTITRAPFY